MNQPYRYGPPDTDFDGERPPRRHNGWLIAMGVGLGLLFVARWWLTGDGGRLARRPGRAAQHLAQARPREVAPRDGLAADEQSTIELFRECSSSVVFIQTSSVRRDRFSLNPMEIPRGTGSGFIWDDQGHIVTNFHVLQGADRARVILANQSAWDAKVVGVAPNKDLAVMRIDAPASDLNAIAVGSSGDLQVGQSVYAIGSPFGLDQTLTTGIISGLDREIKALTGRRITDVVQTDAAINPGNSGGPLLDSDGRLIGVNTSIVSPSGAYAGIGFAIPVDIVNRIVPQLIAFGRVIRPWFGVDLANPTILRRVGVEGVLVMRVAPGGTADEAGVRATRIGNEVELGDIIVQVDETPVRSADDLYEYLEQHEVGDSTTIHVLRTQPDGSLKRATFSATLKTTSSD